MTIINKDRLAAAQALVHRFAQAGTAPAGMTPLGETAANMQRSPAGWPVTRSAIADQLTKRLGGADEPNQMSTSYCGPAAFLYCLLEDRPDLYVAYAIGLWEHGTHDLAGGGATPCTLPRIPARARRWASCRRHERPIRARPSPTWTG